LREEHHQKGLIPLSKFIAENFYRLNTGQQQKIKQNLEFIETDKHILKALADSRRLRVVDLLPVLKEHKITNRQYVSERVNRLVEVGILERSRVGKNVFYLKANREPMGADMSGDN
jgi:predicted transcriptional regulator